MDHEAEAEGREPHEVPAAQRRITPAALLAGCLLGVLEALPQALGLDADSSLLAVWVDLRDTYKPQLERVMRRGRL